MSELLGFLLGLALGHLGRRAVPYALGKKTKRMPFRWPWVELVGGILAAILVAQLGFDRASIIWFPFLALLLHISACDYAFKYVPDYPVYGGIFLGVVLNTIFPESLPKLMNQGALMAWLGLSGNGHGNALLLSLAGAAAGFLAIEAIRRGIGKLVQMEVMGSGDGLILAMIGAFIGPKLVLISIGPACCIGAVLGILGKLIVKQPHAPFGPPLAAGGFLMLVAGDGVIDAIANYQVFLAELPPWVLNVFSIVLVAIAVLLMLRIKRRRAEYEREIEEDYKAIDKKLDS